MVRRNTRRSAGAELFGGGNVNRFSGEPSVASASYSDAEEAEEDEPVEQGSPRRGVTEDISDLTKSISSKFWGVASFLASPSPSQTVSSVSSSIPRACSSSLSSPSLSHWQHEPTISGDSDLVDSYELSRTAGIRSDFAEIGGTLKTGIRRLSNSGAINGISKMAFNFLSLGEEFKDYENEQEEKDEVEDIDEFEDEHVTDVIGVTDEVLAFAGNIACHPETWLDFPLLSEDDDFLDDFDMSVAQQDHALVIESLVPRLAALRIELCPTHMSIWCFWKIYFALLHPRLNKHDADLLSTPQIVEARAMLLHGLQCQEKQESEDFMRKAAYKDSVYDTLITPEQFSTPWATQGNMSSKLIRNLDMETLSAPAADSEFVDKFVVKEEPLQTKAKDTLLSNLDEEEDDDWPEDETQDVHSATLLCNEEDISFSDLEDSDHSYNFSKGFKAAAH